MPTSTDAHLADRDCVPAQPPDDGNEQLIELYELALETLRAHIYGNPMPEKLRTASHPAAPALHGAGRDGSGAPTGVLQPIAAKILM